MARGSMGILPDSTSQMKAPDSKLPLWWNGPCSSSSSSISGVGGFYLRSFSSRPSGLAGLIGITRSLRPVIAAMQCHWTHRAQQRRSAACPPAAAQSPPRALRTGVGGLSVGGLGAAASRGAVQTAAILRRLQHNTSRSGQAAGST